MSDNHQFPTVDPVRLGQCLLVLRATLALFLLLWAIEKFVLPERTVGIFGRFYGLDIDVAITPLIGVGECLLAIAVLAGIWRTLGYGLALVVHAVSVFASWSLLVDPWGLASGKVNHLFLAGVPVLAGFAILFWLREHDIFTFDYKRKWRREITARRNQP